VKSTVPRAVAIPFTVPAAAALASSTGPGPFGYKPEAPLGGASVEIRVWTPGGGVTRVTRLSIRPS
jgi:hypothetical protein